MKIRGDKEVRSFQVANIKGKDIFFFLTDDGMFFSTLNVLHNGVALEMSRPVPVLTKEPEEKN